MNKCDLSDLKEKIFLASSCNENTAVSELIAQSAMTMEERDAAQHAAIGLVERLRNGGKPGLMETFLAEYGLSTDEGIALMCLAEALLRVPDSETIDDLIEDKIVSSSWGEHLGKSSSSLVNAATWGLLFTGKVLDNTQQSSVARSLRGAIKRLGEPVIRSAVSRAMKEMGSQFVLGQTIEAALDRGKKRVAQGYTYSFDMLGEAALTQKDAASYFRSYMNAIEALTLNASSNDIKRNPGISIKLSALHPRYEVGQEDRVLKELVPTVLTLAKSAKKGNLGLNIDAEEADRLCLSLEVIQRVFEDPELDGWDGFGVVVQAYNKCAAPVLDWLYALAENNNRQIMVRLVKGAYWDTEIKRAQVEGLRDYPVFTRKTATDVSYLCCAKKLMSMNKRIYPQFATHNAHTAASILAIADPESEYEFQRLHGMGEGVYQMLLEQYSVRCRIYAPVGKHSDLLAYLVRRLLENGANSSFVNQIVDLNVPVDTVVCDPHVAESIPQSNAIVPPKAIFYPERVNSRGWDLHDHLDRNEFEEARKPYAVKKWLATPLIARPYKGKGDTVKLVNPSKLSDNVGEVVEASETDIETAINYAESWHSTDVEERSEILLKVAELYEENAGEIFAILTREAGKTSKDAIAEIREAVDFLRYYSAQAKSHQASLPRGIFACISPWNFPLAIFTGQMCAALSVGNGVLAKPAESTPLIAFFAVKLFHKAGVPRAVLQLLPGQGGNVGARLVSSSNVNGVCFTGSTITGLNINRSMAENLAVNAPLIAETGGLNAMIVDSTALPEQAVTDIVRSAFQSAGQRCSAVRLVYIQEDVYSDFMEMLCGAIDELKIGDPWKLSTDVGPLISAEAYHKVKTYVDLASTDGRLLKRTGEGIPTSGHFVGPAVIEVGGIKEMKTEIFGPVLHVAKFSSESLAQVVSEINESEYGLTFGLHTRIDSRVEYLINNLNVGNIYVNRDQIGAVVGSQPFGGENLSGTGPKAGGPKYLSRFVKPQALVAKTETCGRIARLEEVQDLIRSLECRRVKLSESELPGPTGESNKLYEYARGLVLCLGADIESATKQATIAKENGCPSLIVCPGAKGNFSIDGFLPRELLTALKGISVVALIGEQADVFQARRSLSIRQGKIIPLVTDNSLSQYCRLERHVCVDTTAAGGNASLLASL